MNYQNVYEIFELPSVKLNVLILVNAYDAEISIEQTLKSILNQNYPGSFGVLVHDDSSTDLTRSLIDQYKLDFPDKVFRLYRKINSHLTNEREQKWALVRTLEFDYFASCDGDDYWSQNMLSSQIINLEKHPENVISVCASRFIDDSLASQEPVFNQNIGQLKKTKTLRVTNPYIHSTSAIMQKKESMDSNINYLIPRHGRGDAIRFHVALQYGRATYQNDSICYRRPGGAWRSLPKYKKLWSSLKLAIDLILVLNWRGKLNIFRGLIGKYLV